MYIGYSSATTIVMAVWTFLNSLPLYCLFGKEGIEILSPLQQIQVVASKFLSHLFSIVLRLASMVSPFVTCKNAVNRLGLKGATVQSHPASLMDKWFAAVPKCGFELCSPTPQPLHLYGSVFISFFMFLPSFLTLWNSNKWTVGFLKRPPIQTLIRLNPAYLQPSGCFRCLQIGCL